MFQAESSKITVQATGATSWRRGEVKYKKNEAFVDVIETVNLSMSAKGTHIIQLLPLLYYVFIEAIPKTSRVYFACRR